MYLNKVVLSLASAALLQSGCEAYDLGDEAVDSVAVDVSNPTWSNGMSELIGTKCANCHTSSRSKFVPSNVPAIVNGISSESFWTGGVANHLVAHSYLRTYRDTEHPMPPKFATPLTDEESTALETFVEGIGYGWDDLCPNEETTLVWDDVSATVEASCASASCHSAANTARKPLTTFDEFKDVRWNSLAYVATAYMPQGTGATFIASEEGINLRDYLCVSADFSE